MQKEASVEGLLQRMRRLGVDKACVWNIARSSEKVVDCNNSIKKLVEDYPKSFIGFANVFPPRLEEALVELERALGKLELSGLKIHPKVQGFNLDDPNAISVLKRAKDYQIPIVTHVAHPFYIHRTVGDKQVFDREIFIDSGLECPRLLQEMADAYDPCCSSVRLANVVKQFNYEKLVAAHFGGIFTKELRDSATVFQTPCVPVGGLEWAYQNIGEDRIIFGSDFPLNGIEDEMEKIKKANMPEKAMRKIFSENFIRLSTQ